MAASALVTFGVAFGVSAALSAALTALVRPLASRLGAVAIPRDDRWHTHPVPLLGGLAIWIAVLVPAVSWLGPARAISSILVAGSLAAIVGIADDFLRMKPSTKLTAQIAIACYALYVGSVANWTASPTVNVLLSLLWIIGITNALNLLDNMDGLCAGIASIAAVALSATVADPSSPVFVIAALIAGASAGFLFHNFPPASIFMGDSGSLFLGATLSIGALGAEPRDQSGLVATLLVPVLLLLIPIFDMLFVTASRILSLRSAALGGRDHTSHRLVAFGFSERQAVLMLYGFAAAGALTAVALRRLHLLESHLVLIALAITLALLAVQLARVRVYGGDDFAALKNKPYTPLLIDVAYKRRIFEVLLDTSLIGGSYYAAYVLRFDTDFSDNYGYFLRSLPIVLACELTSFFIAGVYRGVWRLFSISDLMTYVRGVLFGTLSSVMALVYLYRFEGYSRGVFLIHAMGLLLLVGGSRASFRVLRDLATRQRSGGRRALIYGAGDGGVLLVRELRNNAVYGIDPIGFLDDDRAREGRKVGGLSILGAGGTVAQAIAEHDIQVVIVSTSKLTAARREHLMSVCAARSVDVLQFVFTLEPMIGARLQL